MKRANVTGALVLIFSVIALILMFLVFYIIAGQEDQKVFSDKNEAESLDADIMLRNILDTPSTKGTVRDLIEYDLVQMTWKDTFRDSSYEDELETIMEKLFPLMRHQIKVADETCERRSIFRVYVTQGSPDTYTDDEGWTTACPSLGRLQEVRKEITLSTGRTVMVGLEFMYREI
ncbi:hypothetical protein H6504_03540 [Candidatus Woesearchaeota archaeon]|nr:hypothetical protein [Candidatus Woesearchaeota archaeon]